MNRTLFSLLFLMLSWLTTSASNGWDDTLHVPKAVLVQLRSEHNRIEALTKNRLYSKVEEVQKDALAVVTKMKLDFRDNFSACPVYYYVDTNADQIKKKKFDGVLMNADGSPVTDFGFSDDYLVIYYGYPAVQGRLKDKVTDTSSYQYDTGQPFGKGLVVLNDEFQQVNYFYKLGYDEFWYKIGKRFKKYCYISKHFDIEYFQCARLFNERFTRRRIRRMLPLLNGTNSDK